jgi:hypothetical protein
VDSRQSKVEREKIGRAKRSEPLGANSDAPTGSGQAPDTEFTEEGKRRVENVGDEHGKW